MFDTHIYTYRQGGGLFINLEKRMSERKEKKKLAQTTTNESNVTILLSGRLRIVTQSQY